MSSFLNIIGYRPIGKRWHIVGLTLTILLYAQIATSQIVPSVVVDSNYDENMMQTQLVFNSNPSTRLQLINRRIESASDTASVIALLFQRAFTYQQLGKPEVGLGDFMCADSLIKATGFKYPIPPLDFSDIYVEIEAQLFKGFQETDVYPATPKIPEIFETTIANNINAHKGKISYSALYSYYLQNLLFNITLVNPGVKDGHPLNDAALDYANLILSEQLNGYEPTNALVYDSTMLNVITQSDLFGTLTHFKELFILDSKVNSNDLEKVQSMFFKQFLGTVGYLTSKKQALRQPEFDSAIFRSKSPLIKLLSKQVMLNSDSLLPVSSRLDLRTDISSLNEFLFAVRIRYSPKTSDDIALAKIESDIQKQKLITKILLIFISICLVCSLFLYVSKKWYQRHNKKLFTEIMKFLDGEWEYLKKGIRELEK